MILHQSALQSGVRRLKMADDYFMFRAFSDIRKMMFLNGGGYLCRGKTNQFTLRALIEEKYR